MRKKLLHDFVVHSGAFDEGVAVLFVGVLCGVFFAALVVLGEHIGEDLRLCVFFAALDLEIKLIGKQENDELLLDLSLGEACQRLLGGGGAFDFAEGNNVVV